MKTSIRQHAIATRLKAIHPRPGTAQNTSIGDKTRLWRGLVVASVFCLPFASQAGETINYTGSSSDLTTGTLAGSDNAPGSVYSTSSTSGNSVTVNSAAGADPYRVFGGLSDSATVTGNTVHLLSGSITNNLYGGYDVGGFNATGNSVVMSAGSVGGHLLGAISLTADVLGNSVRMDGGTVTNNIYGGSANGAGKAENNTVTITGGQVGDGSGTPSNGAVLGGSSASGRAAGNSVALSNGTVNHIYGGESGSGNAENNIVTMTGGLVKSNLIGGFSVSGAAKDNIVTIKGGQINSDVYGANSTDGNVTGNTVMVEDGKIKGDIYGAVSWNGDATGNTVTVKGGEIRMVLGSNAGGIVTKNTVKIEGGEITYDVYGGKSFGSTVGGASANTVTISGGKINRNVYGGFSNSSFNTTGNTITISGNPVLSTALLYGGYSATFNSSADHFTGNTLNVQNGGMVVKGIANFENYNFSIPVTLASGGTMLTVTNAVKLTNTNINARVAKSSQLGHYILIQSAGGITGTPNGPLSSAPTAGTPGDYILTKKTIASDTLSIDQALAWNANGANAAYAHGTFTLDAGESFEIDTPLNNQATNAATGWDGTTLTKTGAGTLILTGNNTYSGATTLNDGTLQLGDGTTTGSVLGDITNNATLAINRSDTINVSNLITGSGNVIQAGSGTLTLTAANTYSGATILEAGTLQAARTDNFTNSSDLIVNGGILDLNGFDQQLNRLSSTRANGEIQLNGATLTANNTGSGLDDTTYAGAITGSGNLIKEGGGQLTLSGQTGWAGNTTLNAGTLTLDGSAGGAQLTSNIIGQSGTTFNLIHGATLTGWIDPTDVIITGPASTWNNTGNSVIDSLTLLSGGNYGFTAPASGTYKLLTINGSLSGNGNITMNTNLAAGLGDQIITTETAGQHSVTIRNQGGDPSGLGQSLKLIEVSTPGLSNGTFVLPSGQVDVGAYRYGLLRGEQLAGGDAGDWYLANTLEKSNLTNGVLAAANTAKYATFASLNNLHKRLGELRLDQSGDAGNDLWMRAYEKRYTLHLDGSVDQKVDGFEAGYDHQFRFDGGRFYAGALAGGGQSRIDSNRDGSGSIDNNQIGAYATWILDNGFYVDLIGRHFWFRHDYNLQPQGSTLPETGSADNTAWSLDVETGKRFDCKDGWYLEPQAELNWLRNSRAGFTSSLGNRITLDSSQTVNSRLGLAGGKVLTSDSGRLTQVYGRLDWTKDLSSDGRVAINGNSFDAVKDDGAWTAAIGVQTAGGEQDRLQFYTEVEAGLGSPAVKQNWGVNVGLRWSF